MRFGSGAHQWTLILSAERQNSSSILKSFHYSKIPAGVCLSPLWKAWLATLLTHWLVRRASQERFYDAHNRSKSRCGPQTTVSPSELLGLTASWLFSGSPAVSARSPNLCNNEHRTELTGDLMSHLKNGRTWLLPTTPATNPPVW